MKLLHITIGTIVLYLAAVVAFRPAVIRAATPPLKPQFDEIAALTYAYYDQHGEIPRSTDYLPPSLRGLIGSGTGITWNATEQTYHYQYSAKYPMNISFFELASFGFIHCNRKNLGSSITPDMIRANTPVYKQAGKLPLLAN